MFCIGENVFGADNMVKNTFLIQNQKDGLWHQVVAGVEHTLHVIFVMFLVCNTYVISDCLSYQNPEFLPFPSISGCRDVKRGHGERK